MSLQQIILDNTAFSDFLKLIAIDRHFEELSGIVGHVGYTQILKEAINMLEQASEVVLFF